MSRRRSTFLRSTTVFIRVLGRWAGVFVIGGAAIVGSPAPAWAQACCAGGSVVTPGRLEPHEIALVGVQVKAGLGLGSYALGGRFVPAGSGDLEQDYEEDLMGAVRWLERGQAALLVPLVQTFRQTPRDGGHLGGGVGDVNVSARYDFLRAGESLSIPGIALLAGLTIPTGTAPESSTAPLAVDATGIGAFQANAALALEQSWGPWLVNATAMVAARTPRFGETLGPQFTFLAAGAYTFASELSVAGAASYSFEPDATTTTGADLPASSKRLTVVTVSALWPFTRSWRMLGAGFLDLPVDGFGSNQPASCGLTLTVIRSWS